VKSLEDSDRVTEPGKVSCNSEAGWPAADNGYFPAGQRDLGEIDGGVMRTLPVCKEPLQLADLDSLSDIPMRFANRALLLTLLFLGAYATADGGQEIGLPDDRDALCEVTILDSLDKRGDAYIDRAARNARLVLAMETSLRFGDGHRRRETQRHFTYVPDTLGRFLFWHLDWGQFHALGRVHRDSFP